jgi:hypothetical protein
MPVAKQSGKTTRVRLKSKLGRDYWKFGKLLSPDNWTEFDLTASQLKSIRRSVELPVAKGGSLVIDQPDVFADQSADAGADESESTVDTSQDLLGNEQPPKRMRGRKMVRASSSQVVVKSTERQPKPGTGIDTSEETVE